MEHTTKCLDCKIIKGIEISDDKTAIVFDTNDGYIVALCYSEYGSYTWIEHIELPAGGFPTKVIFSQDLYFHTENDCRLKIYGMKIATDYGDIIIEYRNESDGVYGGDLAWPGDKEYGELIASMLTLVDINN